MKVHVEAKPVHEPLAGGTPGATVSVEPIVTGRCSLPRMWMESPGGHFVTAKILRAALTGKDTVAVPIPTFLIRHPSAGAVVIDTGLHPSVATDAKGNLGGVASHFAKADLAAGEDLPAQLRERGLDAGQIPVVVMTHMHFDHTSAISEFPNSTFVISETEWEAATVGSRPALNGYRHAHYDYAFDYRTVDFDRGGIDSYATFGRTFDLFDDGSIILAFTPGHSPGHMSVIARLKEREFVIGGDVIYTMGQLEGSAPLAARPFDAHNYRRSLQELKLFHREFPAAVVTAGHDAAFYNGLDARYE
jgi:glyoxylase-like metal-dependent hydrolase (beta-lactamase superfamily II)